jgi:hypothetical protein
MGSAVEEKRGANATIPLTRTRASVIALRKLVQSGILDPFVLLPVPSF